ncbi:MAG: hypothetical protein ACUBOA_09850 [Candidatus Loosdrechtia sp.]|uniref:hypothetical protein n=1 Tax=Candidatus Loosdrechtia sp. TaxID=3101272 RepID=UPI003A697A6A|nr:MAG: hypothetical protein QY305_11560 [Candidatus Jettenia sp. AMX2]
MKNNIDRRNFLAWYCLYATSEEIKRAEQTNKETINRLVSEYSNEIEMLQTAKIFL